MGGSRMRLAIIADIHGNIEALRQVLDDIDGSEVDSTINIGDMIGYGPEPEEVVALIRKRGIVSILGNHELAVIDKDLQDQFTPRALQALKYSMKFLSTHSFQYFKGLKRRLVVNDCLCVHGCPPDSATTYLHWLNEIELRAVFKTMSFGLCFAGHTHRLECISYNGRKVLRMPLKKGIQAIEDHVKYIVNVGSVGQPRDGNEEAKYVIWDDSRKTVETRFVPYDISMTADKMMDRGFDMKNALRLFLAQ